MRGRLHKQFLGAALLFSVPDFVKLSKEDHFERELFTYKRANRLMGLVRSYYPSHDLFPAEQVAIREMGKLIHEYCAESREGVCLPVLQRMWGREMKGMVDKLADTATPLITRTAAPSPRSA